MEIEKVQQALDAQRKAFEEFQKGVITKTQFESVEKKTNEILDKQEKANQKALAATVAQEKELKEQNEKIEKLEKSLISMSSDAKTGKSNYKESALFKEFKKLIADNDVVGYAAEAKALNRTDINVDGGYLVPTEMSDEIIKEITEISPIRQIARVMTINSKSIELPKRTQLLDAFYEGETEQNTSDTSKYGCETITPYALSVQVPVTWDMVLNAPNFEDEVMSDVVEAFARAEGRNFVGGDGVKKPEGIITNSEVIANALGSTASGSVSFDDVINVTGNLKTGYVGDAMYTFNRKTNAFLRTLKGSNGQYLWQVQSDGNFNTLNGHRYMLDNQMPDIAAGVIPILFGDFFKGYRIVDRTQMMMIRDEYTKAGKRIINLHFHKWNSGQVVLSEALQAIKVIP